MRNFLPAALLISAGTAAVPKPHCPVYGPLFPAPKHMKNHPLMLEAVKEMDALFDERVNSNRSYSFHFEAYSTEEGPLWSRSWTAAQLQTANTTGVKVVDRNTVHRVGSITKTFTVLTFLSQVGWDVWNHPITKYIPELKALEASQKGKSPIYNVDWDDITIGSLITFQSGLMRDCGFRPSVTWTRAVADQWPDSILGELTQEVPQWKDVVTDWGFPLIVESEAPPCGKERICSKKGTSRATPAGGVVVLTRIYRVSRRNGQDAAVLPAVPDAYVQQHRLRAPVARSRGHHGPPFHEDDRGDHH